MARLFLVHWHDAEAASFAKTLRDAGHKVEFRATAGEPGWMQRLDVLKPEAVIISLDRSPSRGRAIASVVGERKVTRTTPIIFAGGLKDKVAETKRQMPEMIYVSWKQIESGIQRALRHKVQVHPKRGIATHNPLPQKLGIRESSRLLTFNAPAAFERVLGALPDGASIEEEASGPADRVILFCERAVELARDFDRASRCVRPSGGLWIAWPKRTAGVETDLTMTVIREFAFGRGWVDCKVCAIDAHWSASLIFRRREKWGLSQAPHS